MLRVCFAICVTASIFVICGIGCGDKVEEFSGIVRVREYKLSSRVGGLVKEQLCAEGEEVEAGAILAKLDDSKLLAQRAVLEQELKLARAQYERLKEGATPEELKRAQAELSAAEAQYAKALKGFRTEDISMARESVNALQAQFDAAQSEAVRFTRLFQEGVISKSQYEKAIANRDALEAQLKSAQDNLRKLLSGLEEEDIQTAEANVKARKAVLQNLIKGPTKNDLAVAEARVRQVEAEIARLELDLADTVITAPTKGIVEQYIIEQSEVAAPGQPILSFVSAEDIWIEIFVPESIIGRLKVGDEMLVTADPFPEKLFTARIFYISRQSEFTPRNIYTPEERINQVYRVKLKPVKPPIQLRGGIYVTASLKKR